MSAGSVARPHWYSHGWNRVAYYRLADLAAGMLPRPLRLGAARLAGRLAARRLVAERQQVRANLARVLTGASEAALGHATAETFANFAACFSDFLTINRGAPARLGDYVASRQGEEHLDAACAAGRGVILLTAHLGNWEFGGRLLVPRLDRPIHIVLAGEQDADLERYLRREGERLRFVTRRHATSTLGLLAALRRNEAVAMQGDRPTGERGDTVVEFFGAPAPFAVGPFVLARAAGAPVVAAYCVMDADHRYRITVEPPIWVKSGEEPAALAAMVATLERAVRAHPTQWFNFFDVWSPPRAAA
ncbi:MAG TPA: lysophospholipid acyltransferase family protein [Pseudomonadales bacterium]|nr:lysophospholipid acyltransferase family protein [Pseudomonadales bacterium]